MKLAVSIMNLNNWIFIGFGVLSGSVFPVSIRSHRLNIFHHPHLHHNIFEGGFRHTMSVFFKNVLLSFTRSVGFHNKMWIARVHLLGCPGCCFSVIEQLGFNIRRYMNGISCLLVTKSILVLKILSCPCLCRLRGSRVQSYLVLKKFKLWLLLIVSNLGQFSL